MQNNISVTIDKLLQPLLIIMRYVSAKTLLNYNMSDHFRNSR